MSEIPGRDPVHKDEAVRCTRPGVARLGGFLVCDYHLDDPPTGGSWRFQATGGVFYAWDTRAKR